MWMAQKEEVAAPRGTHYAIDTDMDATPMPFADALCAWQSDPEFRMYFSALLADAPYTSFRWELPPVIVGDVATRPFEFVLLDSPELLQRNADPAAFAEHFRQNPDAEIIDFANLGGDARLIVPTPIAPTDAYAHLAAFARNAPESQQHALWSIIGQRMSERIGEKPIWLNTAGAGVSWLHIRLDTHPKYYRYESYRNNRPLA